MLMLPMDTANADITYRMDVDPDVQVTAAMQQAGEEQKLILLVAGGAVGVMCGTTFSGRTR